ncbi:MAG: haloacid dehalogenase-like hydrolase, partial [Eubacterium sp.]|nr:haloacid dehalogenase-like hydrolase [Eubacterium sp.]
MKKPIIAMMYDFDKTLCTKDMQEYAFIPKLGMDPAAFWNEVNAMTDAEEMDNILAYMYKMVEKAREKKVPVTRDTFLKMGAKVEYFKGVETWFDRI